MIGLLAAFVALAVISMGLSCVEGAFYFIKRRKLGHLTTEQNRRAALVNHYLQDPLMLLMPVHIGTYTAHVAMTICVTALLMDWIQHWALLAAFSVMLVYLLAFRLTLPYAIVRGNPERALLLLLPIFDAWARLLQPLVTVLRRRASPEAILTPARPSGAEMPPAPVHDQDEDRVVDAVRRFSVTQVREVMTPRPDVVGLPASGTVGEARRLLNESKYSRVPLYGADLDDIVGVVTVRDLVAWEGDGSEPVRGLARPAHLVPAGKRIADLLREFQQVRATIAVVIDEYGGTTGLVTIEDILEELVGEIEDEYDQEAAPMSVEGDGSVVVDGRVSVEKLEMALSAPLSADAESGTSTVGGLVTAAFGRIPRVGEGVDWHGYRVEVLEAGHKRVNRVRFRRLGEETSA